MPQLNPNPWFLIMLASWLTLSLVIQPKLTAFISTNNPAKTTTTTKTTPWAWPWT
uniref:ATP synthase complex subunit 8 n=2 Tax=Eudyptes TaxID=9235 RepID=A0A411GX76_9AVES|nr:ATP synthase F0 subunit 8 [Eudyptes chrysolophus]QBB10584.1 ATP synthase F0 subunit 8 [Eudyptes schlegeli]QOJ46727.1 ATP synthase F0 subunit 8 [Eudyptes schlegeli]QOJ46740.1 ATP synthase F0 subunit 8 [Eudyptes chrysolophus]QOJ46792.1 ATP synthase F0 subunit 8 [Eudyptes chrysolophus]QPF24479.1 ATP synthase F0 subunit 8 [Eudyptes chrysolophus]